MQDGKSHKKTSLAHFLFAITASYNRRKKSSYHHHFIKWFSCLTDLTLACLEVNAVVSVYHRPVGHGLREGDINTWTAGELGIKARENRGNRMRGDLLEFDNARGAD